MYVNISKEKENFDALDEIYKKIRGIFTNVKTHNDYSINELVELYSNDEDFFNDLKVIENSMTEIADILEPIEVLKKEYYNFLSIRRMISYILNEIKLFIIHISFIDELLINFFNLVHLKLDSKEHDYQESYSTFLIKLEKQKDYFYEKIFKFSDEYDELIIDVTNILW